MKFNNLLPRLVMLVSLMGFSFLVVAQEAELKQKAENTYEVSATLQPTGNYASAMSGACEKACGLQKYDPTALVAQAAAKEGDITRCIVSGVAIKVTEYTHKINYQGQEFYTCCATCAGVFEKEPERFLQ